MKNSKHLNRLELEGFEYISKLDELEENVGRRFIVNNIEVAVFKINSEVFALSNICPHQQTHLIYDGFVEDQFVVCPHMGGDSIYEQEKKIQEVMDYRYIQLRLLMIKFMFR